MTRIVIYTGDGKGKTTAAIGSAIRALGHGRQVYFHQFVKSDEETGEFKLLNSLDGIDIEQSGIGFVPSPVHPSHKKHRMSAEQGLARVIGQIQTGQYPVIVMDEVCTAVSKGLLQTNAVMKLIDAVENISLLILTGRNAPSELVSMADTVSTISNTKHALESGLCAEEGIEF